MRPSVPSFCTPGTPPRNLSVTSLPRPSLAAGRAGHGGSLRQRLVALASKRLRRKRDGFLLVDLAEVVVEALDLQPVAVRRDHLPPGQVVEAVPPQHGLLAAGVHRDVAADARGAGRGRVDGEHAAGGRGGFGDAVGDHAGAGADGGVGFIVAGQQPPPRPGRWSISFSVLMTTDGRPAARRRRCSRCRRRAG